VLGLAVVGLVTGFVLTAPVVSGPSSPTALDDASGTPLIVMGLDGRPTSSTFASAAARLAMAADGSVRVETTASRGAREPLPVPPPAPAPLAAPSSTPVVPAPAPAPASSAAAPAPARPAPADQVTPQTTLPGTPAPPPPAAAAAAQDRAAQVLALVNQERADAGCRPLGADGRLAAVAAAHSADMRDRGFFDHVNLDGLSPFDRADAAGVAARAENIARGQSDAAAVMESWMASPGHRANILDCGLTRLGVGVADGGGGPWWTQLFA
jgi:uncharacterized protein YkwD